MVVEGGGGGAASFSFFQRKEKRRDGHGAAPWSGGGAGGAGGEESVCLSVCLGSLPLVLSASRFRYMAGSLRRRSDARTGGVLAVLCAYSSGARRQLRGCVAS